MSVTLLQPLVSADWLVEHLDEVRVADVRWYLDGRSGSAAYEDGHIPGAVWVDVDTGLSDPPGPGRHPLPSPERFAAAMGRSGIGDDTPVVAYDDAGGAIAARLWWLLHVLDHPVAVLDGGLAGWPGPVETGTVRPPEATFTARAFPSERFVDADGVAAALGEPGLVLLDARPAVRYAHGDPTIDPRPGHIPGARSAPWADNLDPDGHFLPPAALRERFGGLGLGLDRDQPVIAYCGSGVTACHDLLALTMSGVRGARLYTGSWSDWGADPARPAEVGDDLA